MTESHSMSSTGARLRRGADQRGVSLVITLLLLLLLTAMSLTMVLSVSSDMLINGYYRNFRGSFYAADSGANIARQAMIDGINAAAPTGVFPGDTQPIPLGTETTVLAAIRANYGISNPLNTGQAAGSWPEKFRILSSTLTLVSCSVQGGLSTAVCTKPDHNDKLPIKGYTYVYNYSLTAFGQSQGTEASTLSDKGTLIFNAVVTPAGPVVTAFSAFGMFIDKSPLCNGTTLVPGTLTGPVFTNGAWNFGTAGAYEFTDQVSSASSQAGFQESSTCNAESGPTDVTVAKGGTIAPTFDKGLTLGATALLLPPNNFSQERAVLDGKGASLDSSGNPVPPPVVQTTELNQALRDASGKAYPSSGASSGVFLPYTVDSKGRATFTGGGIFVEGTADKIVLSPAASPSTAEVYTVVQGLTTTTVTIDPAGSGTTTIQTVTGSGKGATTTSQTIAGVPQQLDASGGVDRAATMLFVDGAIASLSGPGENQAAIQNGAAVTITAQQDITITGDIRYTAEPVTTTSTTSGKPPVTIPADSLIAGNDSGQVLGIFTAGGNVNLNNLQKDTNLQIDASVASISATGSGGIVNTGAAIGTLNIVGGRIQNTLQNIGASQRNVFFDKRFAAGGFSPPWFPSTTINQSGESSAKMQPPTVIRLQWLNQNPFN